MEMQGIQDFIGTTLTELVIKVLAAIAFWIVGRWLIGRVIAVIRAAMNRNHVDPTLTKVHGVDRRGGAEHRAGPGILGYFGIQTTSFAAMLAGAGVAIGAAWSSCSGTLPPARSCSSFGRSRWVTSFRSGPVGHGPRTRVVRHDDRDARQRAHPGRQRKIFGDTIRTSRCCRRGASSAWPSAAGVDPIDAIARLKAAVGQIPNISRICPRSTFST